jgi:SAM-dependent MidA family methyltransferase
VAERFDRYMHRCLYGERGFYTAGTGSAGRRRDFITSPEVGPLFAAVVARWLDAVWTAHGRPDPFPVIDAGAGPGGLLRGLERAAPDCSAAWQLLAVDPALGTTLPERLDGAVVIANELLDNLAFRMVVVRSDGVDDVAVDDGAETLEPTSDADRARLPAPIAALPSGSRSPWHDEAQTWLTDVVRRGAHTILAFDYGAPTTLELVERGGWLRTYRRHERGDDPYREPGEWDITTDIAFDQFEPAPTLCRQAEFLRRHGIDALVDEGRRMWQERAARPDVEALVMRSRIAESAALLDPAGLGSWLVAEWSHPNRT